MERRAKILATVGPASWDRKSLKRLIKAGANGVRLNLSHGTRDEHRETFARVREVSEELSVPVAIVLDLMGPRFRIGKMAEPVELSRRQVVTFGNKRSNADLPLADPGFLRYMQEGERVLVDNGLIELQVLEASRDVATARVLSGGLVSSNKGINLPDTATPFRVSKKDRDDIEMAVDLQADYLAASYVGEATDVRAIRRLVAKSGGEIPIISKLERARALTNLDSVVMESDAVMVARGDLGVEVPLQEVPVIQKRIIDSCWRLGKPVIVATQMLESMMEQPRPTRAETSDVANAVFDGADALMLSGESAAGKYPIESVATMAEIILQAETYHRSHTSDTMNMPASYDLDPPDRPDTMEIPETVSAASVLAAKQMQARCIVALTQGGFTARQIAGRRPSRPVVACTALPETARRLQLVWGMSSVIFHDAGLVHHAEVVELVDRLLVEARVAKPGDIIVLLMGDPLRQRPPTNLMRIHRVRRPE